MAGCRLRHALGAGKAGAANRAELATGARPADHLLFDHGGFLSQTVLSTNLDFASKIGSGKVRDLYTLGDDLLLVATDRISAFDVVMDEGIPGKGHVLTALSEFWLHLLSGVIPHHLISTDVDSWDDVPQAHRSVLRGRTMRCQRAKPLPI